MQDEETFVELARLLEEDPEAYRREVMRLHATAPDVFEAFIRHLRARLEAEEGHRLRRMSSIRAVVLGDLQAVLAKRRPTD